MDLTGLLIVACLLIYLLAMNVAYKHKTNLITIILLQLAIPAAIIIAAYVVEIELLFVGLSGAITILLFLGFNYSEFWLILHYERAGMRVIILNFKNCEPDSDTINTYKSRFVRNVNISTLFKNNIQLLLRIGRLENWEKMIEEFKKSHPNFQFKNQSSKKNNPVNLIPMESQLLEIFEEIFKDFYLHIIYVRWFFFLDIETTIKLHNLLKIYVFSLKAELPLTLDLNATILTEERENGKKFTAIFAIDGGLSESNLNKITNLTSDLEIVKYMPKFFEMEALEKRSNYFEQKSEKILSDLEGLAKRDLTINQRIDDILPKKRKQKGDWLFGENDYGE